MSATFSGDLRGAATPLPHFWEHTVGSGHATLALRADWQAQMRRAHDELGMQHVRFHGILDDDMGTLICQSDELIYSFFNADQIFDFLLSIGMKPFVELSFMPSTLVVRRPDRLPLSRQRDAAARLCAVGGPDPQAGRALGRALRHRRSAAMVLRGVERAEPDGFRQRQAERLFRALSLYSRSHQD